MCVYVYMCDYISDELVNVATACVYVYMCDYSSDDLANVATACVCMCICVTTLVMSWSM